MRSLVWFRSDLRVDDNPALRAASVVAERGVVALYLVSRDQWGAHDWGAAKVDFVLRSVESLERELERLGIPLVVLDASDFEAAPGQVAEAVASLEADAVFANREYEVNERARDRRVEARLRGLGCPIRWFEDQTIVPPARPRTRGGGFYTVFTPFRRAWLRELEESELWLAESPPRPQSERPRIPAALESAGCGRAEGAEHLAADFPAGEREALRRLTAFADERLPGYHAGRDLAGEEATSRLSPYLAVGSLSIRRCLEAALAANEGRLTGGEPGPDTWIKELAWREFYRHVLVGYPRVSRGRAFREATEAVAWRDDPEGFEAWRSGRTGFPFVDAGMRQLAATGWMHNRLRMVTAMFLTKNLLIDWRAGERHFNRHLIDADLANNNGGWQWSASTGTDSAPYFRIFNPWRQGQRYDPEARFVRRWIPELADLPARVVHSPKRLASVRDDLGYPPEIVDLGVSRGRAIASFAALGEST